MMTKKSIAGAALFMVIAVISGGMLISRNCREIGSSPEIFPDAVTIRNVTDAPVDYFIKSSGSEQWQKFTDLKPGKLRRHPSPAPLEIRYERLGYSAGRVLEPGTPYAFRLDGKNRLKIYKGSHGREIDVDLAPYVPTPMEVVEKMLEMANVGPEDMLYDIGCGDGRIVITAAKKYRTRGVGIDIVPQRIKESKAGAKVAGVEALVEFRLGDATKMDFSEATILALYLLPESLELLRPMFEMQLRPGTRVICHDYTILGWKDREIDSASFQDSSGENHSLFLYKK